MRLILTPFRAEDAVELLGKECVGYLDALIHMERNGEAWTGRLEDGSLLGCAGWMKILPWVVDLWVLPGPLVKSFPILFHRTVTTKFREIIARNGARRFQGVVDPAFPERVRWIQRLGFTKEGRMRACGPKGQDMDLYALVRDTDGT